MSIDTAAPSIIQLPKFELFLMWVQVAALAGVPVPNPPSPLLQAGGRLGLSLRDEKIDGFS